MSKQPHLSRRQFLGQASCAAVGSTALFSTLLNLRMASTAAAQTPLPGGTDYRAMVCLFLAGGADSFNFLAPSGTDEYNEYANVRADLALPQNELLPLNIATPIGKQLGVHPGMSELRDLFNDGNLAWVANVGTLIEPTTLSQYQNDLVNLPLGLYSHADQIKQWQTSVPQSGDAIGWGGRTADLLHSLNDNDRISMNISVAGSNVWQNGNNTFQYAIGSDGSQGLDTYDYWWGGYPARGAAVDSQMDIEYQNLFQKTFAHSTKNALEAHQEFSAATEGIELTTVFPETYLGAQLQMVARTIAAHSALGMRRQTFFVQFGGWDHHDEVLGNMADMAPVISQAVGAFYAAMEEINEQNNVTLFTASDFGRTLTSNGEGSDHAWGGNHFVCGGAVNGANIYGVYPDLYAGNPLDTGRGRLIPSTSVDEYFGELALWFGVSPSDLSTVLPNVGNFYTPGAIGPLGMMG
ncbi:DUF1501 domain-containing protein [Cerasicoccus fimbriatus]|uniref:DUF1501 domain-containing protein n=1 Tax=Cerasicoccus fimbriatus TaxID=3014554 RepID=UPI0022B4F799|nr:DUF1501 domain-containing protein [Cerasicoccus sp. TK19100]